MQPAAAAVNQNLPTSTYLRQVARARGSAADWCAALLTESQGLPVLVYLQDLAQVLGRSVRTLARQLQAAAGLLYEPGHGREPSRVSWRRLEGVEDLGTADVAPVLPASSPVPHTPRTRSGEPSCTEPR